MPGQTYPLDGVIKDASRLRHAVPPRRGTYRLVQPECTATGATVTIGTLDPGDEDWRRLDVHVRRASKSVTTGDTVAVHER